MNLPRTSLLLLAAPLFSCASTDPGGIPYREQRFANVRLDFST